MRLLHLHWPHLLLRLARSRSTQSLPGAAFPSRAAREPIVLGGQPWMPGTVLDANPAALALGIRRGMALGSAHRLAPEATFLDPDPAAEAAAIDAALDRLSAFSPSISGETDSTRTSFGRLEAQIDGLGRLWGPEPALVERIVTALQPILPGRPWAGIAGTRFCALVAARTSAEATDSGGGAVAVENGTAHRLVAVPVGGETDFLAPLPASLLSVDPDIRARLARLGLRGIGQVAAISRSALVARFGAEGERLHARARGEETDPFLPRRSPERLALALPVEPAVGELEPLRFLLHRLTGALADQLVARGLATARVHLRLNLDTTFAGRGTPVLVDLDQRLPEPTSEAEAVERLLLARLERTPPPAPVVRLELELDEVAPAAGQQLSLFVPQAARSARLGWQLARLALAFGEDRIRRVELTDPEAPLAENRWRWVAVESGASTAVQDARGGG